jgi:transposase
VVGTHDHFRIEGTGAVAIAVGVDVAKEFHWVSTVVSESGEQLCSERVDNDPDSIEAWLTRLTGYRAEHGSITVGVDLLGGVAGLLLTMLAEADLRVVHVPGLVVNRARRATRGGEHKSDPRDARVIADQLRLRSDWREILAEDEVTLDLRMLVSRRRELVVDQTRRLTRLRDLLASTFPGLERAVDPTNITDLRLLARYATPDELRRAGRRRVLEHLLRHGARRPYTEKLVEAALAAARAQQVTVAGQSRASEFVREFATEALSTRRRLSELDAEIAQDLERHPDAALIRSLPGMGATLTAEFIAAAGNLARFRNADALAAAAGLAPVLQQSGKTHYLRRAVAGDRSLKFVLYQSAFCAVGIDATSKAFYARKRGEGKRHHQALIALARRRVNVLYAILRTRQPYRADHRTPTAA